MPALLAAAAGAWSGPAACHLLPALLTAGPGADADNAGVCGTCCCLCTPRLAPSCNSLPPGPPGAAAGTLLGCLPNNLFAVNAGAHLGELQSLGDLYSGKLLLLGLTAGAAALTPIYFQRRAAAAGRPDAGNGKRD